MKATPADLEWSARIDQALEEYPEMREYLDGIRGNIEALAARLAAVRELHRPIKGLNTPNCTECNRNTTTADILADYGTPYPCPTIQALEGDRP